ncbi:DinB family protein [Haploplasma axanthum]|uniref:DinB-like domain-containing protein n=1 Tax=Haploplasma axanthum TaxID=29552 RepID=A0A449BDB5_HAPAX|nr:DinB family protein [Haploplasma axanthum]VEU80439.1 Uncharacterised protein [Haploplasma axanthum]
MHSFSKEKQTVIFKNFQSKIKKEKSFAESIESLIEFRIEMWNMYEYVFNTLKEEEYKKKPIKQFKTIAYYLYHLNRIEDITLNTLIKDQEQIFYKNNYQERINSKLHTTGNELTLDEVEKFSERLNIKELIKYVKEVFENTNNYIKIVNYLDSRTLITSERKEKLLELGSVSNDSKAFWLVDYWCKKDYQGIMLMPFSKHHFMHLWNSISIIEKLN